MHRKKSNKTCAKPHVKKSVHLYGKRKCIERYSIFMGRKIQYLKVSDLPTRRRSGNASVGLCRNWQDNSNLSTEKQEQPGAPRAGIERHKPTVTTSVVLLRGQKREGPLEQNTEPRRGWRVGTALPFSEGRKKYSVLIQDSYLPTWTKGTKRKREEIFTMLKA